MLKDKLPLMAAAVAVLALIVASWSLASHYSGKRTGYIILGKVMQDFEMKKEKERQLQDIGLQRKQYLDSLKFSIDNFYLGGSLQNKSRLDSLKYLYDMRASEFAESNQSLYDKYNGEVMDKITGLSKAFAEEQGYDIILGADGSGVLMYADESMDVTEDFTGYINKNYKN